MARFERGVARLSTIPGDTGCEVAPKCLECPLARCKYDEPVRSVSGARQALQDERYEAIRRLRAAGMAPPAIAEQLKVGVRMVFRATTTGGQGA